MKMISIVTPCYNEEENVDEVYESIAHIMSHTTYDYEHIFIDNSFKYFFLTGKVMIDGSFGQTGFLDDTVYSNSLVIIVQELVVRGV